MNAAQVLAEGNALTVRQVEHKTGGGCSPRGVVPRSPTATLEMAQRAIEWQAKVQEERARQEAERQKKLDLEKAWEEAYQKIRSEPPAINSVFQDEQALIRVEFFSDDDAMPAIYALILLRGQCPEEMPYYGLAQAGHKGMKCFLSSAARRVLRDKFASDEYLWEYGGSVNLNCAVRITGHTKTKKAVHGEIVQVNQ